MATMTCCIGGDCDGHHPFCDEAPRGIEVRGFIAMNGSGQLCFFADTRATGVPLDSHQVTVRMAIAGARARHVSRNALAELDPQPEPKHDCEAELKARPDYSVGHGTPPVFDCSCGKRYAYVCEESEGAAWELVK